MRLLFKILGIVSITIGLMVLFFGLSSTDTFMEKAFAKFTGRFSEGTMYYLVGGVGAIVGGIALTFLSGKQHHNH